LLSTVDWLDSVAEDWSEFSGADDDGGSLGPNPGDAGSDAFAAEAICFQISVGLVTVFEPVAFDDGSC